MNMSHTVDTLLIKLLLDEELVKVAKNEKKILMRHLQLHPVGRCNQQHSSNLYLEEEDGTQLSQTQLKQIMYDAKRCGCVAVTISGEEPLAHPDINNIIKEIYYLNIDVGLVTDGSMLNQLETSTMKKITWTRVSSDDSRDMNERCVELLNDAVCRGNNVDWSFSHTVSRTPNFKTIKGVIGFANEHNLQITLIADLLDMENVPDMSAIKSKLVELGIDDSKVIYQGQRDCSIGVNPCYTSLLKPVVTADGYVLPCNSVSCAERMSSQICNTLRLGRVEELVEIWEQQKFFDGSVCARCYCENYNWTLKTLLSKVKHQWFV